MVECNYPNRNAIKVLVGNKCDKVDRKVTEKEGKKLALEYKIPFFEASAKSNFNTNEIFQYTIDKIIENLDYINSEN